MFLFVFATTKRFNLVLIGYNINYIDLYFTKDGSNNS